MAGESDLSANLEAIGLPEEARAWLLDLWNLIQVLDDAFDDGPSDKASVSRATWAIFQNMPLNGFFRQYAAVLQPILVLQLLKWEAANTAEAADGADERSYMWRAGYYEVVLMCCHLCGLDGMGATCMALYGETFDEYMEGF